MGELGYIRFILLCDALINWRCRGVDIAYFTLQVDDKDVSELGQTATVALLREKPIGSLVTLVVSSGPHHQEQNCPSTRTSDDARSDGIGSSQNVSIRFY